MEPKPFDEAYERGDQIRVDYLGQTIFLPKLRGFYNLLDDLLRQRVMPDSHKGLTRSQYDQAVRAGGLPVETGDWGKLLGEQLFPGSLRSINLQVRIPKEQVRFFDTKHYYFADTRTTGAASYDAYLAPKPEALQKWVENNVGYCTAPDGVVHQHGLAFYLGAAYTNLMMQALRTHN